MASDAAGDLVIGEGKVTMNRSMSASLGSGRPETGVSSPWAGVNRNSAAINIHA